MTNEPGQKNKAAALGGLILFLAIFFFYYLLAPPFAVPGRWSGIAAIFSGLDPFRPVIRPVWSGLTALISALPVANIGWAFNIFTSIAGAASCWLLYEIVRRLPFSRTLRRSSAEREERIPRLVAGLSAALFAAASSSMIVLSTHGDYAVTDLLLLLLALYPAALFMQRPQWGYLHASCAMMGLALIEYPAAAMVFPGFLLWWGLQLWGVKLPGRAPLILAGTLLLSGVIALFAYAIVYAGSLAGALNGLTDPLQVMSQYVRLYYAELTRSVPRVGWLLIIGLNIVPFFAVMVRELDEPTDRFSAIGIYAFRIVLVGVAVMTLFNLPGSPGHVVGAQTMLLLPSIFVAIWSGFLIGYYHGVFKQRGFRGLAAGLVVVWVAVLFVAGVRHGNAARSGQLEPVVKFAHKVIENLEGRDFIITDGSLDSSLRLAARERGVRVNLINIQSGSTTEYGRYLASMFVSPEYQSLAALGPAALLRDWLTSEPDVLLRVALLASPEFLRIPGIEFIPGRYTYQITRADTVPDLSSRIDYFLIDWESAPVPDTSTLDETSSGWFQSQFVIRWFSRLANDLGFLIDQQGEKSKAALAYEQSLRFWPENLSALLNQLEHAESGDPGEVDTIEQKINAVTERNPSILNTMYLHMVCGRVRNPVAMLEKLSTLSPEQLSEDRLDDVARSLRGDREYAKVNLARLYLRGADADESEAIYLSLLATNPENLDALYGLFQVALFQRKFEKAAGYLDRMVDLGVDEKRIQLDRAALKLAGGDVSAARTIYLNAVKQSNAPGEAWLGLLNVGIVEKNDDLINTAFEALDRNLSFVPGLFMLGERALLQRQPAAAKEYYQRVIGLEPSHEAALIRLLQLAFDERDVPGLRRYCGSLLELRPNHAFANYMAAFIHIDAGDFSLAEAALRRSVAVKEDGAALNELAYVISQQNKFEDALVVARRAVELSPENYNAWDTLADIHQKIGQRDEAIMAIEKAVSIKEMKDPAIYLHAAELYAETGNRQRALDMLQLIDSTKQELSDDLKRRQKEIAEQLSRSR